MTTLEQLRKQLSVMPCRFASSADGIAQIPVTVATQGGGTAQVQTDEISLLYGFPTKTSDAPPSGGSQPTGDDGLWILRADVNSAGCLASDELFFRLCGGFHTFDSGMFWSSDSGVVFVSDITVSPGARKFVRNATYDTASTQQQYYAWTCEEDVIYTITATPAVNSALFSIAVAPSFASVSGVAVEAYTAGTGSAVATIEIGTQTFARDEEGDSATASGTGKYYCWGGEWYTLSQQPAVGSAVYVKTENGTVTATTLGASIDSVNRSQAGGGYPEGAVLEYEVNPFLMKVMSQKADNRADYEANETEIQTEANWRIVEPEKSYDINAAVCQVDWSNTTAASGQLFSYSTGVKPHGFFAKSAASYPSAGGGRAGVVVAVKDEEEAKGY